MAGGRNFAEALASMDPDSEEYREMVGRMNGIEGADGLLTNVSRIRSTERNLRGEGRRGRRGAGETALNMVSGGRASELELSIGSGRGRRRVGMNSAMGILSRGGSNAEDIVSSLSSSLTEMGVTNAESLSSELGRMAEGGLNAKEAATFRRTIDREMDSTARGSLGDVSRRANEAAMRAANPLDSARNDLLTEIRNGIRTMVTSSAGAQE
jgi:hypothetical protein